MRIPSIGEVVSVALQVSRHRNDRSPVTTLSATQGINGAVLIPWGLARVTSRISRALGSPDNPLSRSQQVAKFHDNATHALRRLPATEVDATIEAMLRLEQLPDARAAWGFLTAAAPHVAASS